MKETRRTAITRAWKKLAIAIPTLIVLLSAIPTDSAADSGHRGRGHAYGHYKRSRVYAAPNWVVPRHIYVENRSLYQPYLLGRAYYGPHRHYHSTYQFPVYVNGFVAYRPYAYCGDQVFISASAPLPRLAFNVTFGVPPAPYGPIPFPFGGYISYHQESWDDDDD
ncbi:MAG: hypothetical protein L0191_07445 [Acidobacteria bacterium]|nr:hypothetical protein [Acidobacteriota bacterium]MCI0568623.1 hypothetical protein [Acidobacteriota bacterium]